MPSGNSRAACSRRAACCRSTAGNDDFGSLGGLASLKAFCKRSLLQPGGSQPHKRPRGVLLLGVPGTGKSAFAKALGEETGRPTVVLDVGALMGSLVGQTEGNIRQALRIADAMAPAILFIDECEKALSGVASSGQTDSGVSARLFGSLLTWMNDHTSDVYLVATCNDISKLPPEFSRAERFDGMFFLNLPGRTEKDVIWRLYLQQFQLDAQATSAGRRELDRGGDPGLLPPGGVAGPALGPGRPERRAGGGHGQPSR